VRCFSFFSPLSRQDERQPFSVCLSHLLSPIHSWCGYPYNDTVPGFAPSLAQMKANFGGNSSTWEEVGTAFCGLEAVITTPSGRNATLFITDAFDDTCVSVPFPPFPLSPLLIARDIIVSTAPLTSSLFPTQMGEDSRFYRRRTQLVSSPFRFHHILKERCRQRWILGPHWSPQREVRLQIGDEPFLEDSLSHLYSPILPCWSPSGSLAEPLLVGGSASVVSVFVATLCRFLHSYFCFLRVVSLHLHCHSFHDRLFVVSHVNRTRGKESIPTKVTALAEKKEVRQRGRRERRRGVR
jgi:hypothetical protein